MVWSVSYRLNVELVAVPAEGRLAGPDELGADLTSGIAVVEDRVLEVEPPLRHYDVRPLQILRGIHGTD
jgi:hypothetical protein